MHRRALVLFVAAAGVVASCSGGSGSGNATTPTTVASAPTTTAPVDDGELRIGLLLPSGGVAPDMGVSMRAAVDEAVSEINTAGGVLGRPVRIIDRVEGDSAATSLSLQDLLQLDVDAVVGPTSSLNVLSTLGAAVKAGVLTCSPTASAMSLDGFPDQGLFIRTIPSDSLEALALARVVDESGSSDAVIAYLDDAYGRPFAEATDAALVARGTKVTESVGFTSTEGSISAAVANVVALRPSVVVVLADAVTGPAFINAVDAATPVARPTYVVNDAIRRPDSSTEPFDRALSARVVGVSPVAYGPASFLDALQKVDRAAQGLFAQQAYDCVNVIALAAQASGSTLGSVMATQVQLVSNGGTGCADFRSCVAIMVQGRNPDYNGPDGLMSIAEDGDPRTGFYERFGFDQNGRDVGQKRFTVERG